MPCCRKPLVFRSIVVVLPNTFLTTTTNTSSIMIIALCVLNQRETLEKWHQLLQKWDPQQHGSWHSQRLKRAGNTWPQNGLSEVGWSFLKLLKLWKVSEHLDFWISAVIPGFLKFRQTTSQQLFFLKFFLSVFFLSIFSAFPKISASLKKSVFLCFLLGGYMSLVTSIFVGAIELFASKAFQRYDATNDGFLDIDELAHTLKVRRWCVFFFVG